MSDHHSRGLTLLEVLLSSAILAMLAAACAPIIARAMSLLQPEAPSSSLQVIDLAGVADAFIAEPQAFGLGDGDAPALHEVTQLELPWPSTASSIQPSSDPRQPAPPIMIRAMARPDPDVDHVWLAFDCDGLSIYRWVSVPESPDGAREGEADQ